jgi:alpha-L-rhamnosidase
VFAPRPAAGIDRASAFVDSAYGRVAIDWHVAAGELVADVELPFGTTGEFRAPMIESSRLMVNGDRTDSPVPLGPGRHRLVVVHPGVANASPAPTVA